MRKRGGPESTADEYSEQVRTRGLCANSRDKTGCNPDAGLDEWNNAIAANYGEARASVYLIRDGIIDERNTARQTSNQ